MAVDIVMPQMGESIFEGTITKWLKKPGDRVERDEPLFEISTDKVDAEIPSPSAGVLKEIKVGEGKTVQWPTGEGAKGNAGVAGAIQQTVGAVGYVEQAYALQHNFTYASVKNKAGQFVAPTLASTSAAAQGVKVPANLGIKIANPAGAGSYPITSQTFIVVNKDLCKAGTPGGEGAAKGVVKFIQYGLAEGQSILSQADYASLPAAILAKAKSAASSLQCNGAPLG